MNDVKLKRVKVNEYHTEYHYTDSKFFPLIVISKHYEYSLSNRVVDENQKDYYFDEARKVYCYFDNSRQYLRTLKDVKAYLAVIDDEIEQFIQEKYEARIAEDAERLKQFNTEKQLHIDFLKPSVNYENFKVGDRISAYMPSLNKCCNLGGYLYQIKDTQISLCHVEKILQLTNKEYDHFTYHLMDHRTDLGNGGSNSEADIPNSDDKEIWQLTKAEVELWRSKCYSLVTIVQAPNRKSIVTDAQGHQYARYVGVHPEKLGS